MYMTHPMSSIGMLSKMNTRRPSESVGRSSTSSAPWCPVHSKAASTSTNWIGDGWSHHEARLPRNGNKADADLASKQEFSEFVARHAGINS